MQVMVPGGMGLSRGFETHHNLRGPASSNRVRFDVLRMCQMSNAKFSSVVLILYSKDEHSSVVAVDSKPL